MPPRVFVSSVVRGFGDYREAARRGIEAAGCHPVLVNEDFPALAESPRNACLDAVGTCDAYVGILGPRAGHVAPSGKLVVEEEYEEALRVELPVLFFVQAGVEREPRQQAFVERVSAYVEGRHRITFETVTELEAETERAVRQLELGVNEDPQTAAHGVAELLGRALLPARQQPTLRAAFVPTRVEEAVDPATLEDRLGRWIMDLGHSEEIGLLSYESSYHPEVSGERVRVLPTGGGGRREPHSYAAVEMAESGRLLIETNVTNVVARGRHGTALGIAEEDVEIQLRRTFSFAAALFDRVDRYDRQQALAYNAGLFSLGYQTLLPAAQLEGGGPIGMSNTPEVVAHSEARVIARRTLRDPESEIARTMTRFRRALNR